MNSFTNDNNYPFNNNNNDPFNNNNSNENNNNNQFSQHEMVQGTLRDLMSPITPMCRLFMSGIMPSLPKHVSDYIDDDFQEADNKTPCALKSNFDKNRYNFLDFGKVNENDDENNNNKRNRKKEGLDDEDDRIENQFGPILCTVFHICGYTSFF